MALTPLTVAEQNYFMELALDQARQASAKGEVPIGCVIVHDRDVIASAYNHRELKQDALAHAEILAIHQACERQGSWRLTDARLFVTLEPCPMCAGAIINSRIAEVYFGASDPKAGAVGSLTNLFDISGFNHHPVYHHHLKEDEAQILLRSFFRAIRQQQKEKKKALRTGNQSEN